MRCKVCCGTGEIMGLGFQMKDCPECTNITPKKPVVDKRSKSYKNAIKQLQEVHPDLSMDEVSKMFDEEFEKIES